MAKYKVFSREVITIYRTYEIEADTEELAASSFAYGNGLQISESESEDIETIDFIELAPRKEQKNKIVNKS